MLAPPRRNDSSKTIAFSRRADQKALFFGRWEGYHAATPTRSTREHFRAPEVELGRFSRKWPDPGEGRVVRVEPELRSKTVEKP
jgi:hypothetical protein